MDELTTKQLQAELEKQISDWSLYRLRLDLRLKYMKRRMIIIGSLILVLEVIHAFIHQLVFPPYNSILTLALSVWFVVLVVKYSIGYKDKHCTRSADKVIKIAAEYNEAIKDVPNARRCDFLPPEIYHQKKRFTTKKRTRAAVSQAVSQAATATAAVAQTATQAATASADAVAQTAGQAASLLPSVEI